MKIQIKNYTFNKAARTVTFTDYTSINLDSLLLITNVTSNVIIYNFACVGFGGSVLGNILTLDYDTSGMSNTDNLQIFYEDGQNSTDIINTTVETFDNKVLWELRRMVKLLESNATVDIANRQRVVVENTITALGTYGLGGGGSNYPTVGAPIASPSTSYFVQTWSGPVDPRWTNIEQAKINYNTGVRNNLSFS